MAYKRQHAYRKPKFYRTFSHTSYQALQAMTLGLHEYCKAHEIDFHEGNLTFILDAATFQRRVEISPTEGTEIDLKTLSKTADEIEKSVKSQKWADGGYAQQEGYLK